METRLLLYVTTGNGEHMGMRGGPEGQATLWDRCSNRPLGLLGGSHGLGDRAKLSSIA
jgi:hypothetical protein